MVSSYTYTTTVEGSIEDVRGRVEAALKDEGFGILTEIDVAATLKSKLGLDRPAYLILGACNASLANRALEIDPSIGALLPCNVVLRRSDDVAQTIVEIMEPIAALGIAGSAGIEPIADEAAQRLRRVRDAVGAG